MLPDLRLGGAQRVLLELSSQFADRGHDVELLSLMKDGPLAAEIPRAVRYKPLQDTAKAGVWLAAMALPALVSHLRAARPDAVLSSMTGTNVLTSAAHLAAGSPGRLVLREAVSLHNSPASLTRWLVRLFYARADALLTVSRGVAEDLARVVGRSSRIVTVHNPVNGDRIRSAARSTDVAWQPREPYVVSIARLIAQKDPQTLLRAYALSNLRHTHRLVLVGDGDQRAAAEALAAELKIIERVDFLGAMSNPYPVLAGAALHVLSSRWEGYPNVLLEALALRVPVVSTDCPSGPRELLQGGRLGRLAPTADPVALAAAMDAA